MIIFKPDKIKDTDKIMKFKKQIGIISNKHKAQIINEILIYAKKIKLTMDLNIIIDVKVIGKNKVIT